jgi:aryl-alcohol dehydrogenase-like predicted oxidoreductase
MGRISRRNFIRTTTLATGAYLGAASLSHAFGETAKAPSPVDLVPLGKTGIKVSRLGLGTGTVGFNKHSHQTRLGQEKFGELVRHAYERGINFFDLADMYGSHALLARAMKDAAIPRDKIILCTKIWLNLNEDEEIRGELDRFRQELETDYLDIVLLQCMMDGDWPKRLPKWLDYLSEAKQKKIIRAHGVSNHTLCAVETAARTPWVDCILARINPKGERMDGPPEAVLPLLKEAHAAGKGVAGMKILAEGYIIEGRQESLRFALGLGCVDSLIIGFETPEEIDDICDEVGEILRESHA